MNNVVNEVKSKVQIFMGEDISLLHFSNLPDDILGILPDVWAKLAVEKLTTKDRIGIIWSPAMEEGEQIGQVICSGCEDLFLLYSPRSAIPVKMCYIYHQLTSYHCLVGNPPNNLEPLVNAANIIAVPYSYRLFAKIHDGFCVDGDSSMGLYPTKELTLISQHPDYQIDEIINEPKSNSLLMFSGNGLGDLQCYDLDQSIDHDYYTFFWDHETRNIYKPQLFWDYLASFIREKFGS